MPQGVEHKASSIGLRWRLLLGAALAVLAGVLLAPTPARAGCGDHVILMSGTDSLASKAPMPAPIQPNEKPAPCSGPTCSHSPIAPAPAPTAPVAPSVPEWACVLALSTLPVVTFSPHPLDNRREPLLSLASSIYHPPR
jgi:hypothetical protein